MVQHGSLALSSAELGGVKPLPRGRTGLPGPAVRRTHRNRILRSMIAVVAENGYQTATVAQVVARARVSRSSFYAQFPDKEECFFAATSKGHQLMLGRVRQAVHGLGSDASDELRVRAGLREFLQFLTDEPAFAMVFYVELPGASRRGVERMAAAHRQFAGMTATWHRRARARHPQWPEVPDAVYLALTGATEQLVKERVRGGGTGDLLRLEDLLVALHLRLLTGDRW